MLVTRQWSIHDEQAQNHLKLSNMTKVRLRPIFNLNVKTRAWHILDTCRVCETLINQFLDLKNPQLESTIIKIGQETPKIWGAIEWPPPSELHDFESHQTKG